MYPNLLAELARRKMTSREMATKLGMTTSCFSQKMNGKSKNGFSLRDAKRIKAILATDESLEYLFTEEI